MLTQTIEIDQITKTGNGSILYRRVRTVFDDGVQISQTYERASLAPGSALDGVPEEVQAFCALAWTPEVVAAHEARVAAANADLDPPEGGGD
ncbi:MAG: hypothetical protein INF91_10695 [Alphaproteobacteria bacterium]|nr:hypothetical protein [Alphaproteobacteria bacterium]